MACGGADCGICGRDSLIEAGLDVLQLADLGLGGCRFIEAEPAASVRAQRAERSYARTGVLRVATKYPRIARAWYERRGVNAEIVSLHGNIELGPIVGMADRIVDITATGTTLRENDLVVTGELMECTAQLFVNPGARPHRRARARARAPTHRNRRGVMAMRTISLAPGERLVIDQLSRKGCFPPVSRRPPVTSWTRSRAGGDVALRRFCREFDGVDLESFHVPAERVDVALEGLDAAFVAALEKAASQIRAFHEREVAQSWFTTREDGTMLGVKVTPLAAAGTTCPAAVPSTPPRCS